MNQSAQQKLDQLIDEFDTAMLVTNSLEGELRARPMAIAGHAEGGLLYFATRSGEEKLAEIFRKPEVAITMQGDGQFLSLSGRAQVETDAELAGKLWSSAMKVWFPDGDKDPHLTLIQFTPERGEYWDRTGLLTLEFLWEAGKALLRGEAADDSKLSGHAKLEPRQAAAR